jgi:predicted GNAT superfamily acetyltransferase
MKDKPTIRNATVDDLPRIVAISRAAAPHVSGLSLPGLEDLWRRATTFLVADEPAEASAYLIAFEDATEYEGEEFGWFKAAGAGFLHIDQVAVAPAARRRGLGRLLYAQVARVARARGLTRLTCGVNLEPPNPDSLRFHAAAGFGEVGRLNTREGQRVSLQAKLLTGAA